MDASLAGEGDIEIVVHGPSGSNLSNHVTPLGPGIFTVNFVPMESGMHKATVNFNHEHVLGCCLSDESFRMFLALHETFQIQMDLGNLLSI